MDRRKIYVIGVIMAAVCIISGIGGYFLASGHFGFEQNIAEENNNPYLNENGEPVISSPNKITPSTKIVYEYVYSEDGTVKTVEEEPPYFMLDLTFDDMLKYYPNWEIVSFSPQKVVMRKTIYGSDTQRYIVTDRDGVIVVYYEENGGRSSIKEITNIKTVALSNEEKERLKKGIIDVGEYDLSRVLEDYSS